MARNSALRASDADRDAVAELLRRATVEGRLEPHELEERLHAALRARTYGDLRRVLVDLPARPAAWSRRDRSLAPAVRGTLAVTARIVVVLVVVAVVLAAAAALVAWWAICVLIWLTLRMRRGSWGCGPAWRRPPGPVLPRRP